MRIITSAFSAIDAVFCLINLVGFFIDIIRNRRDKDTYIKLISAVGAFILFFVLYYSQDAQDHKNEFGIYDSQGIYEVSDAEHILKDIVFLAPSDIDQICEKYKWIRFDWAASSVSELPDEVDSETGIRYYHTADAAIDGSLQFSWQEGVDGVGVGSSLTLGFREDKRIKFLAFYLGNWRGDQNKFDENYIPSSLDLRINGEYIDDLRFIVEKEVQYVIFENAVNVKEMTLTIKESQPGRGVAPYDDCCIAEVCAFG